MLMQISSGKGPSECELAVGKVPKKLRKEINDVKIVEEVRGKYVDCYKFVVLTIINYQPVDLMFSRYVRYIR